MFAINGIAVWSSLLYQIRCIGSRSLDNFFSVVRRTKPDIEQGGGEFDVILQGIGTTPKTESLIEGIFAGCQAYSTCGNGKGVFMPMHEELIAWETLEEGIMFTFVCQLHFIKTYLGH